MYHSVDSYLAELRRELRLLSTARLEQVIGEVREDLDRQIAEKGESVMKSLPWPDDLAAKYLGTTPVIPPVPWLRALAFIIDIVLLATPAALFVHLAVISPEGLASSVFAILGGLVALGLAILYFPLSEVHYGRSLGKALVGLTVIQEDKRSVTIGQAFLRRLPFWFGLIALDALFSLFNPKGQRLFDMLAKTQVADTEQRFSLQTTWKIGVAVVLCVALLAYVTSFNNTWSDIRPPDFSPGEDMSSVALVEALDLSQFRLTLTMLNPPSKGKVTESLWSRAEGSVRILVYKGTGGRTFVQEWSLTDQVKMMSVSSAGGWSNQTSWRYRTRDAYKMGWHKDDWAFVIEVPRSMMNVWQFSDFIEEITRQMRFLR